MAGSTSVAGPAITFKQLEPQYLEPYTAWKQKPGPDTLQPLLKKLDPVLDTAIHTYGLGSSGDLIRGKAKIIAAKAIPRYDPDSAKLNSFLYAQLQGLRRVAQKQQSPIRIPERVLLDQQRLFEAEGNLKDELGREPDDVELSDYLSLPIKKIEYIRKFKPARAEGSLVGKDDDGQDTKIDPSVWVPGKQGFDPWTDFVYHSLEPTDRVIFERTVGLHGKRPLQTKEIAKILRITPSAVSQRKTKIKSMLDKKIDIGVS